MCCDEDLLRFLLSEGPVTTPSKAKQSTTGFADTDIPFCTSCNFHVSYTLCIEGRIWSSASRTAVYILYILRDRTIYVLTYRICVRVYPCTAGGHNYVN